MPVQDLLDIREGLIIKTLTIPPHAILGGVGLLNSLWHQVDRTDAEGQLFDRGRTSNRFWIPVKFSLFSAN